MRLSFIDCGMVSCSISLWAVLGTFAVIFPLLGVFNCQPFVLVGSSTANLSCWLVLICCNRLSPRGFQLPFFSFTSTFLLKSLLKGFSCHSFAFTGTFLPAAAWPLPPRQSQQSLLSYCSRIVYVLYQKVVQC